jgi:excisionase family DNA binding protein
VIVDGVLVPPRLAARYAPMLHRVVAAEFRRNGIPIPADLGELLWELSQAAEGPCGPVGAAVGGPSGTVRVVETWDSSKEGAGVGVEAAAVRLGVTTRHVRRLIAKGRLPATRVGTRWLVDPSALGGLVDERSAG